ncbi:MAG: glycosyltransferase family 4 protein [candidate division KSB1 bacterium]|nr:glycosyltransferase family 4 protein [candidate division KSB1 bacterium]MDZ7365857.1 glycosyltransferase family 4 protein [candidate division KSB1 bacterium]MDZ7403908.1 glycosyltransferase family 4 protein [candidate division KSB1 bacterium]
MRIGIDASSLPTTVAGAGKYICGLIKALAQIDDQNEYALFVKVGTQNFFGALPDNFTFVHLPDFSRPSRLLWQHLMAGADGRRCRVDVWHGLHYSLPCFPGAMRRVSTFHDVAFFLHPQLYPPIKRFYFQQAIRGAWQAAEAVIAVSQSTADDVRRLFQAEKKFDENKLRVVPSGVDAKFFSTVSAEEIERVRARYVLNAPYILFLGTLEKRKNLPLLISAFRRLRDRGHRDLLLVLAGLPGNGQPEVKKALARENVQDAVRCLGYVAEADILPLYQGAELFALPSLHEGFGFPLLEAMASGVPVLAAANSAMRELAADHDMLCSGDAEAWAAKMERMLLDTALRQKLIAAGRQRALEFSWQQTAHATRQIYESVYACPRNGFRMNFASGSTPGNGAAHPHQQLFASAAKNGAAIREAVLQTLAYADLFDYPLRPEEIHDGLFACEASLNEVNAALSGCEQRGVIERNNCLYFIRGRSHIVAAREQRRQQSRLLLQKNAWLLRLIINFPFVRSLALSGAMAFENCQQADDIDVFIITAPRRLWTVYVALVLLLKLLGKRQTICLNCLLDLDHLRLDESDFFVAHQIAFLRPLSGFEHCEKFQAANAWIYAHLPQRRREKPVKSRHFAEASRAKMLAEKIFSGRVFDYLERLLFTAYRRRIRRKTAHLNLNEEAVVAAPGQIKLFTNNHRHRIKEALSHRLHEIRRSGLWLEEVEENHVVF